MATQKCELKLASEALRKAKDHGGLLLLATSSGNKAAVEHLAQGKISLESLSQKALKLTDSNPYNLDAEKENKFNVAFLSNMLTGNLEGCLNLLLAANRLPEAAMFSRTYLPSKTAEITQKWKCK